MRLAVISDIQGNTLALESVLQHIQTAGGIDQIICLGDVASGPEPVRVLDLLREHQIICVRGNMDEVIASPQPYTGDDAEQRHYSEMDQWCHAQLSPADLDYLHSLPLTYAFEFGTVSGLCFHGSPHNTDDIIEATTPEEQLHEMLKRVPQTLLLTGHMHLPMLRTFGDQVILNPGSVGLPYGGHRPMPTWAEYATITINGADFTIMFHRVAYDAETFKRRLLHSGMPHAEWYLTKWLLD